MADLTDFLWSLKNGDLEQVKEHIEKKRVDVNGDVQGRKPIHHAADFGHLEVIRYLLNKGANVNATDKHGISALLAAVWEGHTDCVRLMIEKGASKRGQSPDGMSYLDCAEKKEIKDLLTV